MDDEFLMVPIVLSVNTSVLHYVYLVTSYPAQCAIDQAAISACDKGKKWRVAFALFGSFQCP